MTLQDLKATYLARHRMSLDDSARDHLNGFVLFVEAELAKLEPLPEAVPSAMPAVAAALAEGAEQSQEIAAGAEGALQQPGEPATPATPAAADAAPPADDPLVAPEA